MPEDPNLRLIAATLQRILHESEDLGATLDVLDLRTSAMAEAMSLEPVVDEEEGP